MPASLDEILDRVRQHPRLVVSDDYELAIQKMSSRSREFAGGRSTAENSQDRLWISLRVVHRKQPGRAAVAIGSTDSLPQLVESAFEAAKHSAPDPWFRFPLWKSPKEAPKNLEDSPSTSLFEELEGLDASMEENYETLELETRLVRKTERLQLVDKRKIHGCRFAARLDLGEKNIFLKEERAHSHPLSLRRSWLKALQTRAFEQRESRLLTERPRSLLLTPAAVVSLLAKIAPWFLGDKIQEGKSPFGLPTGKAIFSPLLTLIDDGELAGGVFSAPFDHEGALSQQTILVDKGDHRGVLFDTYTATRDNRLSTGNFLKRPEDLFPSVAPSNLFFQAGSSELSELVGQMQKGMVVESWDEELWEESQGTLKLVGRGWAVEAGKPTKPIFGTIVTCRIIDLLRHVVGVGKDLTFFGPFGSPSILCEDLPLDL